MLSVTTHMNTFVTKNEDSNLDAQSFSEGGEGQCIVHCQEGIHFRESVFWREEGETVV